MVQFDKKAVRNVQIKRLNQELEIRKPGEILMIYDDNHYIGYLGWEKESWNRPENIVTERAEYGESIEEICETMLARKPVIGIPVFKEKSEPDNIVFAGKARVTEQEQLLITLIERLKQSKRVYSSEFLPKYRGILLLGSGLLFNQLEALFTMRGLKVLRNKTETPGDDWLILDENVPEFEIMKQQIIEEACMMNMYKYQKVKCELKKKGIPVILIACPCLSDLELTEDETYRVERSIGFDHARKILESGSLPEKKELERVYQKVICEQDMSQSTYMKLSEGEVNTLYVCGPCLINGVAPKGDCLPEILYQEIAGKFGYKIERIVIFEYDSETGNQLLEKEFKENDLLIIIRHMSKDLSEQFKSDVDINLTDFFQNRSEQVPWFADDTMHMTGEGGRQLVKYLYPTLAPYLSKKKGSNASDIKYKQIKKLILNPAEKTELETYFEGIKPQCFEKEFAEKNKIGAVVVNCNPFTNGHKHLLCQVSKQVDGLYVFVVEEDLSVFPFTDRMELVKAGVEALGPKVKVIPSGRFVLSNRTFASYFAKDILQTKTVDASEDVTFFGQFIAPELHIDIRFFGEEPIDTVTRQYNEDMKRKLPYYGVQVKEIPRIGLSDHGDVISASKVRAAWKENNWELLSKLVPTSTLHYLQSQNNKESFLKREIKLQLERGVPEKRREQLSQIRELIEEKGMAILYGTGLDGTGIVGFLTKEEQSKILFCDKRAVKGEFDTFEGIPVIAPEVLFDKYHDKGIYITTTLWAEEIFEQLMDGGIAYSNIFFNPYSRYLI